MTTVLKSRTVLNSQAVIIKRTLTRSYQYFMKPIVRIEPQNVLSQQENKPVKIDQETVNLLERLSLVDCANEKSLKLIENAVNFANVILSVNTEGIDPLVTVTEDRPLCLRDDKVEEGNNRDAIISNAAVIKEDYFVVPPGNISLESEDLFKKTIVESNK